MRKLGKVVLSTALALHILGFSSTTLYVQAPEIPATPRDGLVEVMPVAMRQPEFTVKDYPVGSAEQIAQSNWFKDYFVETGMKTEEGRALGEGMLRGLIANANIVLTSTPFGAAGDYENGNIRVFFSDDLSYKKLLTVILHELSHGVTDSIIKDVPDIREGIAELLEHKLLQVFGLKADDCTPHYDHQAQEIEWLESMIGSKKDFWQLAVKRGGANEMARIFERNQDIITFDQFTLLSGALLHAEREYSPDGMTDLHKKVIEYLNYIKEHPKFDPADPKLTEIRNFFRPWAYDYDQIENLLAKVWNTPKNAETRRWITNSCTTYSFKTAMLVALPDGITPDYQETFSRHFWASLREIKQTENPLICAVTTLRAEELMNAVWGKAPINSTVDKISSVAAKQLEYALGQKIDIVNDDWQKVLLDKYNQKFGNGADITKGFARVGELSAVNDINNTEYLLRKILDDCYVSRAKNAPSADSARGVYRELSKFYEKYKQEIIDSHYGDAIYQNALKDIQAALGKTPSVRAQTNSMKNAPRGMTTAQKSYLNRVRL